MIKISKNFNTLGIIKKYKNLEEIDVVIDFLKGHKTKRNNNYNCLKLKPNFKLKTFRIFKK